MDAHIDPKAWGEAAYRRGRWAEAAHWLAHHLQAHPEDVGARLRLAQALLQQGDAQGALSHFQEAARRAPRRAEPQLGLGLAFQALGMAAPAETHLHRALALERDLVAAHWALARLYLAQDRPQAALPHLEACCRLRPGWGAAWNELGLVRLRLDRVGEAMAAFRRALEVDPESLPYRINLAEALRHLGDVLGARCLLETTLVGHPEDSRLWTNLALAWEDEGDYAAALEALERALALDPDNAHAHWNRALLWLRLGRLAAGWDEYPWGRAVGIRRPPPEHRPRWQGPDDLRPLWLTPEQGIGDEILFAGCLPDLLACHEDCLWQGDPRLLPLLQRRFPRLHCRATPPEDAHRRVVAAIGDLPGWFRRRWTDFPRTAIPWLQADPRRRAHWRRWLTTLGPGLKVGLTWRAGIRHQARARRGIPFPRWAPLMQLDGICWINLQHGDCRDEAAQARQQWGRTLHEAPALDRFQDLDGLAALLCELDLVVTVDNAVAHLAGALGVPTLLLLPAVADWRWFVARRDSPWYPSLTLLRQRRPGRWEPVMDEAAQALARAASGAGAAALTGGD